MTLDGVTQGPGAPDEDTTGGFAAGGWLVPHFDEAFEARVTAWTLQADAFLLGRRTYEGFAEAWPKVTDPHDAIAAALNGLPKLVVSTTLRGTPWGPAEVIGGEALESRVRGLREAPGREVQVHGSTILARCAPRRPPRRRAPPGDRPRGGRRGPAAVPARRRGRRPDAAPIRDDAGRARDPRVRGRGPARDGDLQQG